MAILWQQIVNGTRYEIRGAGRSRRLYENGVFHSQYHPHRYLTGSVWDLLMLPAFFYPAGSLRRVLVLGVGGGTVIRALRHYIRPAEIVGLELNPVHLRLARRFLGLEPGMAELHQGDARDWLAGYRGPRFDMIIDDLFGEQDGMPVRAVQANAGWFKLMRSRLAGGGVLVANFASVEELAGSAYYSSRRVARDYFSAFRLTSPVAGNAVGVFLDRLSDSRTLRANLRRFPELTPDRATSRLRYRIRRLQVPE